MNAMQNPKADSLAASDAEARERDGRADALAHAVRPHRTLWRDAVRRLIANRLALLGGIFILGMLLVALLAPVLAPTHYNEQNYMAISQKPSAEFPLGTDLVGRDMLSRIIYGARVSMAVGFGAQIIVFLIGVPLGALAGYAGGKVDNIIMRFVDVMYAFPQLLFVILIMSALGPGLQNIFIAIGLTGWVTIARLTRAEFLSMRERDYIQSARAAGAAPWRLITRHMLPNALTSIIIALTFGVPQAIFTEASLSFIGVGMSPTIPTWGGMVGAYQGYITSLWHLALFPAFAIALVMMAFTFFGDGLRDALDPRMKRN